MAASSDGDRATPRSRAGLWLTPVVAVAMWVGPLPLEPAAHRLAAIFAAVVVAWVTEVVPIAVTALLIAPALIAAGVCDAKTAFAPYADPLLFLFVGGFFIARAMSRHRLDRRIAARLLTLNFIAGVPWRVRGAFMVSGLIVSMWISNTASTAMLLPILLGSLGVGLDPAGAPDEGPEGRAVTGSLLAVAFACSVGGLGTVVGSPPNLITMRFLQEAGIDFGFVDWLLVGLPASLILLALVAFVLRRVYPPKALAASAAKGKLVVEDAPTGRLSRAERVTAFAFGVAVVGWMVPGILKAAGVPGAPALARALPGGAVALIAASILFVFRDEGGRRVLPWSDASKIDWGIIMLFGGGITLGRQMMDTGLAAALSRGFVDLTGVTDVWSLTAIAIVFTIFFTEVCSNTASANMIVPLVIAAAVELGVSPLPPALGVGLAASCAFMMPIATGPNAVAYGTGRVPLTSMLKVGTVLNVLAAVVLFAWLRGLGFVLGWT